ncbi:hypothetical protein ABPG73_022769 [Tetrahymena malaccensis]
MIPNQSSNNQKDNNKSIPSSQPSQDKPCESEDQTQKVERKKRISKPKTEKSKQLNKLQVNSKTTKQSTLQPQPISQQSLPPQYKPSLQAFSNPPSMQLTQYSSQQNSSLVYNPALNMTKEQFQQFQLEDSLEEMAKQKKNNKKIYNLEEKLILEVKTLHKHFQFNKNQDQTIPIMVSVKTLDQANNMEVESNIIEGRPNIDLICVIDNSGSMEGSKIENVKNTILQLIEILNPNDRLSLITFNNFANQLCGLRKVNTYNKELLQSVTKSINACGGTNITSGLQTAFDILQNRKQKNQVSSIFLLSDGQDTGSDIKIRNLLRTTNLQLQDESFTIHSFGFGNDHDGPLMQKIAQIKDGSFYYVEKTDQVDEFFIDALGGLFSVVAQDLTIKIEINRQNELFGKFFQNSYVSKSYGHMWNVVKKDQEFIIKINQIFSGVSKDFIFELTIPKSEIKGLQDFERNIETIRVQLTASPLDQEQTKIVKENNLVLTLFTESEQIAQDLEMNDNVEFNYIRVKAAQAIEDAMKYADRNQYNEGQIVLSDMLKKIEQSHPKNQSKLQVLKEDLIQCQQNVQPQVYQMQGRFQAQQQCISHYNQQSQAEAVIAELKSKVIQLEKANSDLKNQLKKQENEAKKQDDIIKELKQSDTILQQKAKAQENTIEDFKKQLEKKLYENQEIYSQMFNEQESFKQEKKKMEERIAEFKQSDFYQKQKINEQEKRIKDLQNQLQNNIQKMNIQSMQNPFFNNQQANLKQEAVIQQFNKPQQKVAEQKYIQPQIQNQQIILLKNFKKY